MNETRSDMPMILIFKPMILLFSCELCILTGEANTDCKLQVMFKVIEKHPE